VLLDAGSGDDAWKEHLEKRITNHTVFFDLGEVRNKTSSFRNMAQSLEVFIENMKKWKV